MGGSIETWLGGLGLERYATVFRENDVGMRALPHVTEDDLIQLGVSLGHRRILLAAIAVLKPQQAEAPAAAPAAAQTAPAAAERRHLTAFFADLAGFTELTNRFGPEEMRGLLQRYQDTVAGEVSRFGGYIAKYLGDGLLVYFGWPTAYEDHPYRAVAAGLGALRRIRTITAPDGRPLSARIGVASGPVVVGDLVGENTREESAVTGSVLNLAARIQAHAPENSLVIPAEMQALLGGAFDVTDLGAFTPKGFAAPQRLLQVTGERKAESRFRATRHRQGVRTVGRRHERGLLEQAWSRARAGTGEAVVLAGEAGIGKSRLVEDFLEQQEVPGTADLIRLNCSPYFTTSPFHPVAARISQDAELLPADSGEAAAAKVRALLERRRTADLESVLPVYAALAAPQCAAAQPVLSLPPEEQKDLTARTLLDVVRTRAKIRPVLLAVEDAHWIDASTAQLLDRIVATCSDIALMVLLTHRPDWSCGWAAQHDNVTTLQLRRLSAGQAAGLIRQIAGQDADPDVIRDIVARTDGVPLFAEELARAVFAAGAGAAGEVPSSLQGAMMARLDAVPDTAKQTALTASVFGREFQPDLLAAAMGRPLAEIRVSLEELCRSGLIFESGQHRDAYVFRHALLRDTAYQSMITATRRAQHQQAARALLDLRPAEVKREPELAARHHAEAGEHAAAFELWCAAAEKALARSASQEAVANAEAALRAAEALEPEALAPRVTARTLLGRGYESIGHLPGAMEELDWATEAARKAGLPLLYGEAAYRMADAALMSNNRVADAYAACRDALGLLPAGAERLRCRLLSQLARCAMHTGRFTDSASYSRKALALAAKLGDTKAQFAVMMSRFLAPVIAREPEEVTQWRQRLDEMQAVADGLGDIDRGRDRAISLFIGTEMGDRTHAEHALDRLAEVGQARNHAQLHWIERHGRAMMAILDGDFAAAESFADEALKIGRRTHGAHVEGVYGVQMFTIRREQARLNEVAPVIKKLLADNPGDMAWKPGFGVIAAELGFADAARRILKEIAETGFDLPLDALYSTTLGYLADICTAVSDAAAAGQLYALLLPYRDITVTAGVTTVCNGAAGRRLGALAALLGDWPSAAAHFETALEIDRRMQARPWIARTQAAYACALRRRGRSADAKTAGLLEAEALETAANLGMISLASSLRGQMH